MVKLLKSITVAIWLTASAAILYITTEPYVQDHLINLAVPEISLIWPSIQSNLPLSTYQHKRSTAKHEKQSDDSTEAATETPPPQAHLEIFGLLSLTISEANSWSTMLKMLAVVLGSWLGIRAINSVFDKISSVKTA